MTDTLLSLISIIIGIIAANLTGLFLKKYSFGIVGNTIAGVFGSIFMIKMFGYFISPDLILKSGTVNYYLLSVNLLISFVGGVIVIILLKKLLNLINK